MGGEQSHERKDEEREEEEDKDVREASGSATEDAAGELPQCNIGSRRVDNMCFMISCTNWY